MNQWCTPDAAKLVTFADVLLLVPKNSRFSLHCKTGACKISCYAPGKLFRKWNNLRMQAKYTAGNDSLLLTLSLYRPFHRGIFQIQDDGGTFLFTQYRTTWPKKPLVTFEVNGKPFGIDYIPKKVGLFLVGCSTVLQKKCSSLKSSLFRPNWSRTDCCNFLFFWTFIKWRKKVLSKTEIYVIKIIVFDIFSEK